MKKTIVVVFSLVLLSCASAPPKETLDEQFNQEYEKSLNDRDCYKNRCLDPNGEYRGDLDEENHKKNCEEKPNKGITRCFPHRKHPSDLQEKDIDACCYKENKTNCRGNRLGD